MIEATFTVTRVYKYTRKGVDYALVRAENLDRKHGHGHGLLRVSGFSMEQAATIPAGTDITVTLTAREAVHAP